MITLPSFGLISNYRRTYTFIPSPLGYSAFPSLPSVTYMKSFDHQFLCIVYTLLNHLRVLASKNIQHQCSYADAFSYVVYFCKLTEVKNTPRIIFLVLQFLFYLFFGYFFSHWIIYFYALYGIFLNSYLFFKCAV